MADGTDKMYGAGRPLLEECVGCRALSSGVHRCAFLAGRFDPSNWNCQAFVVLARTARRCVVLGYEVCVNVCGGGVVLVWDRRVGEPQRVRSAVAFGAGFEEVPVTVGVFTGCIDPAERRGGVR
jgi:hypothetical protein